jgi:Nucleoside phosphorylase
VSGRGQGAGFVVALPAEARTLNPSPARAGELRTLPNGARLVICGVGPDAAERAARLLVRSGVTALVSWGTAGGLDPRLRAGALVLANAVIDGRGGVWSSDAAWSTRLAEVLGTCATVDRGTLLGSPLVVGSCGAKADAFARLQAVAVDMESVAVARVAGEHGLPFVTLRVIVDAAHEALPRTAALAIDPQTGRPEAGRLLRALAGRPGEILALMRLARRFGRARKVLSCASATAGPLLLAPALGAASA